MANETFFNNMERALRESVNAFQKTKRENPLSDLFVNIDTENGAVAIYDDNDELLHKEWIEELQGCDMEEGYLLQLQEFFRSDSARQLLETINIDKPFSIILTDDELNETEELLLIDDDNIVLDNKLLEKYDQELDLFIKKLLEE